MPTPAETSAVPIVTNGPKVVTPELSVKAPIVEFCGLNVPPFTSAVVIVLMLVLTVPPDMVRLLMVFVLFKFTTAVPLTVAAPKVAGTEIVVSPPLALSVVMLPPIALKRPLVIAAEPMLPPERFRPPPVLIVTAPTLVAALPRPTLPPLIASVGVASEPEPELS